MTQTPDHIERAAESLVITETFKQMVDYKSIGDEKKIARWMVEAFDAAGLIASPAHDATVAAKALRDFADGVRFPNHWILFRRDDGSGITVSDLLRETADGYIERAAKKEN